MNAWRAARSLAARTQQLELMDDRAIGGTELTEALRQLRVINALLLAYRPTVRGVAELWHTAGRPQTLSLLDVGAGSGDAARALLRWAERHNVALRITLLDLHPDTCAVAAAVWRDEPRVRVVCGDIQHLPPHSIDIVTAALVMHHFSDEQLPALLHVMVNAARFGVVINDLHRHPLAYAAISIATRWWSRNRMIRNDAPLSVRRGFVAADWKRLCSRLSDVHCSYRRQAFSLESAFAQEQLHRQRLFPLIVRRNQGADLTYDVVIIGAGLAGSGAAAGLARRGWKVLIVERRQAAQHKVCGEFLSPEAQGSFRSLGLYDAVHRLGPATIEKTRFVSRNGISLTLDLPGTAWGISRYTLDPALAQAARAAGAELILGTAVTAVETTSTGYTVAVRDSDGLQLIRSRAVIAACGRHALPSLRPPQARTPARQSYVGVKCHYSGVPLGPEVHMYLFDGGYAGLGSIENGRVNLCLLVSREVFARAGGSVQSMIATAVQRNRQLAAVLEPGHIVAESACSVAPVDTERAATAWCDYPRVGDAVTMIPPLCGDGMAMALRGAELCVHATDEYLGGRVSRDGWRDRYVAAWNAEFGRRLRTGRRLQRALHTPLLDDTLLYLGNWMPKTAQELVRATRGTG